MRQSQTPQITDYEFSLVGQEGRPFLGYVSSVDRTNLSPQNLVKGSKNMIKKLSGTWANRWGLKRRGSADSTIAAIASAYVWNTSLGNTIPLRVVNYGGSSSKLQFESDIVTSGTYVWYDLMTSLSLTRFVFDTWWNNTLKKDQLLMVNGSDDMFMWSGGIGVIVSTTVNTIVFSSSAAALGFQTSGGTVKINGNTYTYSGITSATLTGVAGDPTGEAAGSVVYAAVVTTSNTPAADFAADYLKVVNNQVYVGSYSSRLVYISSNTDYTSYTPGTTPGAGDLITMDATGKGIGVRLGKAHLFAGTSYLHIVEFTQITVGSTLTRQTTAPRQDLATLQSALAHEFIDTVGDSIVYLSQEHQVTIFGIFRNITQPKYPTLSLAVRDELQAEDFTGGQLICSDEFIFVTAPVSGLTYMHQTRERIDPYGNIIAERLWHPPQVWSISRISIIDGVLFGNSNANPQLYQLFDTSQWHDDSPNLADDGITYENLPYYSVMRVAYMNNDRRQGLTVLDKVYWEGYMTQGTNLNAFVLFEYQGSKSIQGPVINSILSPAQFFTGASSPSIGDSSLGDNPLGDGIIEDPSDQEFLPKFRAITNLNPVNCFEYEIIAYSNELDCRWEMLCLGTNEKLQENQQAGYLNK